MARGGGESRPRQRAINIKRRRGANARPHPRRASAARTSPPRPFARPARSQTHPRVRARVAGPDLARGLAPRPRPREKKMATLSSGATRSLARGTRALRGGASRRRARPTPTPTRHRRRGTPAMAFLPNLIPNPNYRWGARRDAVVPSPPSLPPIVLLLLRARSSRGRKKYLPLPAERSDPPSTLDAQATTRTRPARRAAAPSTRSSSRTTSGGSATSTAWTTTTSSTARFDAATRKPVTRCSSLCKTRCTRTTSAGAAFEGRRRGCSTCAATASACV